MRLQFPVDTFEEMDDHFHELKGLLQFRDKEKERKERYEAKLAGKISNEEKEMDDWNREVKVCYGHILLTNSIFFLVHIAID